MQLVIAEKPSVAMNLAKVLGAGAKRDGYAEGNGWLVSWCVVSTPIKKCNKRAKKFCNYMAAKGGQKTSALYR